MSATVQNVLFLYLNTGNGHHSGAQALSQALVERYPGQVEAHAVDALDPRSRLVRALLEDGYRLSSLEHRWLWPVLYELGKWFVAKHFVLACLRPVVKPHLRKVLRDRRITKIVLLHYLPVQLVHEVLREEGFKVPVVTVVMDPFTVHPFWFLRRDNPMVLFSQAAHATARRHRVPEHLLTVLPLALRRRFEATLSPEGLADCRARYGYQAQRPLVLFAGGGDGLPKAHRLLREALRQGLDADLVIVCGRNERLRRQCEAVLKRWTGARPRVDVLGFVDHMYELMNLATVVVSKGGPATVMETLLLNKPLVVVDRIYGQEQGNVDFVVDHGVGFYLPRPAQAVRKVAELVADPAAVASLAERVRALGLRNGTDDIVRHLFELDAAP